ncbi:MAG: outer membrane protein assembly factor BamB [Burkholderiales bacterium]
MNGVAPFRRGAWRLSAWCATALVAGCSMFSGMGETVSDSISGTYDWVFGASGPKPSELPVFKPTATLKVLWQVGMGPMERSLLVPVVTPRGIAVANAAGTVAMLNAADGKAVWRTDTKSKLTGGVGSDGQLTAVGSARGEVIALDGEGKERWRAQLSSEVLAPPQIADGIVVTRSGDNRVFGLDANTGLRLWFYQRQLPPLAIRSVAGVSATRGGVFVGFPGGRLVALAVANGGLGWEAAVALPRGATELERIADIASTPMVDARAVYAVAFQGRIGAFDLIKGQQLWARDLSSYAGLGLDASNVYVTDDKGAIHALDKAAGASMWKQDKLAGRQPTAPLALGRFVVVGDLQGYVHVLSRDDGAFVARIATDGSPIASAPVLLDDSFVVQTRNGGVYALTLQ